MHILGAPYVYTHVYMYTHEGETLIRTTISNGKTKNMRMRTNNKSIETVSDWKFLYDKVWESPEAQSIFIDFVS